MKRALFLLLLQVSAVACFADEYKDPATNVIYTYDPAGNRAEVKEGIDWIDTDNDTQGFPIPGSPDVKAEIVILDRFVVKDKEYIVDKIGMCAFAGTQITSVVIPSSIKSIDDKAFMKCVSLSNVVLLQGLSSIESSAFSGCSNLKQIFLPEGLKSIGAGALDWCGLSEITIPSSVEFLGMGTFTSDALRTITSLIKEPFEVYDICNKTQQSRVTLRVPTGTKPKYESTLGWNQFSTIEEFLPTGIRPLTPRQTLTYYDLDGRALPNKPARGINIVGGKKVLRATP